MAKQTDTPNHQREFDEPQGWQSKTITESPLIANFPTLWSVLRSTYQNELTNLAFSKVPNEQSVADSFTDTIRHIAE